MTSYKGIFVAAVAAMSLALPANAVPVLDQSFDAFAAGSNSGIVIDPSQAPAQTFTVGIAGLLSSIGLQVRASPTAVPLSAVEYDIRTTLGGTPTTTVLGTGSFGPAGVPPFVPLNATFVTADLTAHNIMVGLGDVLAIVLRYSGVGNYSWLDVDGDQYTSGGRFISFPPNDAFFGGDRDAGFQTFVDPDVTIPEPASLAILGLGLTGLGLLRRRKRRT